jgi:hypothetical protein
VIFEQTAEHPASGAGSPFTHLLPSPNLKPKRVDLDVVLDHTFEFEDADQIEVSHNDFLSKFHT